MSITIGYQLSNLWCFNFVIDLGNLEFLISINKSSLFLLFLLILLLSLSSFFLPEAYGDLVEGLGGVEILVYVAKKRFCYLHENRVEHHQHTDLTHPPNFRHYHYHVRLYHDAPDDWRKHAFFLNCLIQRLHIFVTIQSIQFSLPTNSHSHHSF